MQLNPWALNLTMSRCIGGCSAWWTRRSAEMWQDEELLYLILSWYPFQIAWVMRLGMSSSTGGRTGLEISFEVTGELGCSLWTAGWLGRSSWAVWILDCFLWADGSFWASWILSCPLWTAGWLACSSWAAWLLYCPLWTAEWLGSTLSADNVSVTLSSSFRVGWVLNGFWEAETGRDEIVWLTLGKISWSSCSHTRWDGGHSSLLRWPFTGRGCGNHRRAHPSWRRHADASW